MNFRKSIGFGIIPMVLGGFALAVLMAFLFGAVVMLLWNWLMPDLFGLKEITYWQGWGLVLLSHLLFKTGHSHYGRRDPWRHRDPDREEFFRDRLRERFGGWKRSDAAEAGGGNAGEAKPDGRP